MGHCVLITYLGGIFIDNSTLEALQYMIDNGKIDLAQVQEEMEMKKREDILQEHKYEIWLAKDGFWKTYLPTENGRKRIKRSSQHALEEAIITFYGDINKKAVTFDDMYFHRRSIQNQMVSDNTIAKYNTDYKRYYQDAEFSQMEISKITEENVKVFIRSTVGEQKLCKKACKTLFGYTKNVFKSAEMNHAIQDNPMKYLAGNSFIHTVQIR